MRNISNFENEFTIVIMNKKLYNNIKTIFFSAIESTQFILLTFVRKIAKLCGDIRQFVSDNIKEKILKKFKLENK